MTPSGAKPAEATRVCELARERDDLPGLAVAAALGGAVVFAGAWGEADLEHHVPLAAGGVFEGRVRHQAVHR